ncbi:MAG: hypothetical protein IKZ46_02690 [Victivallales bacterium]|jgi:hypothetical protein|nr:hypothetical protein [Victivallales bacterium]
MLPRFLSAILFCLVVTAQEASTQLPEQSLRRIIRGSEKLTAEEKTTLLTQVRQYPNECVLSTALFPQADQSRLLVGIAVSMDKQQKKHARELLAELIETKINTLLCDTVLDQLGLYSARRPRYDRVMGMMLAYSLPADFMDKTISETTAEGLPVFIAKLNDKDIIRQFREQGPAADPSAVAVNRNRLRNAISKQIAREMLGFLQQGKNNSERIQDAKRCHDELSKIIKTRQEIFPDDDNAANWNAKPLMDAAAYCLILSENRPEDAQDAANEAFFTMTDSVAELPRPWFAIVKDYAVKYHRKQDYDFLMSNSN